MMKIFKYSGWSRLAFLFFAAWFTVSFYTYATDMFGESGHPEQVMKTDQASTKGAICKLVRGNMDTARPVLPKKRRHLVLNSKRFSKMFLRRSIF